ncbi:Uncharacterized conserved protein [Enterobacter cloacae]|uniref:Uncharacterized conserved protein n=1 Tax=Enterobacter cloacae TaxID=550 RepID=A0A377M1T1_ENTCL|nr:Uncharacterized conserved protein [Enterobacter cloacae]
MINKILVSACLMGSGCVYNGSEKAKAMAQLSRWQAEQRLVIHCPELAAGVAGAPTTSRDFVGRRSGCHARAGQNH